MKILIKFVLLLTLFNLKLQGGYLQQNTTPILKYLQPITLQSDRSGLDSIDCIYVINLDVRPHKWERMKALMLEKGLHPNRVPGVNGWKITDEVKKELAGPYRVRMEGGPYGCLLSHFSIYKDALERGFNTIWVCEDDLDFTGDINQIPVKLKRLSEIDPDWDIFYTDINMRDTHTSFFLFSRDEPGRPDQKILPADYYAARVPIGDDMMYITGRYGCHSMIISKKGLKKISDYLSHIYVWTAIDCDVHFVPGIRQYASISEIVTNLRVSPSDTHDWSTLNSKNKTH